MAHLNVPFHLFTRTGREADYVTKAFSGPRLSGEGPFCQKAQKFLEHLYNAPLVVLTPSCTAALEMSMMLSNVGPGDEVILPSFTFSSSALAVVSRHAVPVFVDIDPKSLNIDTDKIEAAITKKTKVILPVDYAGVGVEIHQIKSISGLKPGIQIVEDAAQAVFAQKNGQPVGHESDLATLSFHDTKNITCGEGGALVINNPDFVDRAHLLRDKGTNRRRFLAGQVDKYTWVDEGSSFLMSEVQGAILLAQLEEGLKITESRLALWHRYEAALREVSLNGRFHLPKVQPANRGNGHLFYILLNSNDERESLRKFLFERGITAISHYQPLHSSPAGKKFGRSSGRLSVTENVAETILRLPLFYGMTSTQQDHVCNSVIDWCQNG